MSRVAVIGAGMGGLAAALRLARLGHRVTVFETRTHAGGLAANEEHGGLTFDIGPYLLLDRPGLAVGFEWLGLRLEDEVDLVRVEHVCEIGGGSAPPVRFHADLVQTAAELDAAWPGSGARYTELVASVTRTYARLNPLLFEPVPRSAVWRHPGAWPALPFLLQPLAKVLGATGLPRPVIEAIAIWSHFVGQPVDVAPSPMAFAPMFLHVQGAHYARGGIGTVPAAIARAAVAAGVEMRFGSPVSAIRCVESRVQAVALASGEEIPVDAVVSNHGGLGAHRLVEGAPVPRSEQNVVDVTRQSPGACAWLAMRGPAPATYLRFHRPDDGPCAVLVQPRAVDPDCGRDGVFPARLIAPIDHAEATRLGPEGQRAWFEARLAEGWWRGSEADVRVLAVRTPSAWGADFSLPDDAMNPAMTAKFMRRGRLPHANPDVRGLYLAGSATHPGQFVAFCAQSGVHAANRLHAEVG
jgi:phytoene dehydrogenase-like protein